jgi:hypothetical protein
MKSPDIRDRQNDDFPVTRPLMAPKRENDPRLLKGTLYKVPSPEFSPAKNHFLKLEYF